MKLFIVRRVLVLVFLLGLVPVASAGPVAADGKVKVFVLAGQSNMQGFGQVAGDSPGTMESCVKGDPEAYGYLVDGEGKPVVRDDVWVVDLSYPDKAKGGWLTTGFGVDAGHIGPEYGFGFVLGEHFEDPVLLIKCAWGGRSLKNDFLSPSAEDYPKPEKDGDKGFHYAEILRIVGEVTANLDEHFPDHGGEGYEIVGFGWHQGWNDRIDQSAVDVYEGNLVHLVNDLRRDLGVEGLPFVVANTGMGGWEIPVRYKAKVEKLMEAQLALADGEKYPDYAGNVAGVETRDFQRSHEESPSGQEFHWMRNWETYYLIGKGMGEAMVGLLEK